MYFCAADKVRHRWLVAHAVLVLHTEIHTHDLYRTACVECFHGHFNITFRVIVAFDVIRATKLAGLLSCAVLLKDDRCAAVQYSLSLLLWILLLLPLVALLCIRLFSTARAALPT